MLVAIETGGTKLQAAVAPLCAPESIREVQRVSIRRDAGATGIREQLKPLMRDLLSRHQGVRIGFGFGGPVDAAQGIAITSHQIDGWDGFPLRDWCVEQFGLPTSIGNDCDLAALAESVLGAGRGFRRVLYVTVGTGVGGGWVVDGKMDGLERPAVAEIGHLRPGLTARNSVNTVEAVASGLGIERVAMTAIANPGAWDVSHEIAAQLAASAKNTNDDGAPTAQQIAAAAANGNALAEKIMEQATETLGWALAQATTLFAPNRIVIGGGVSLIGENYLQAVRAAWRAFVFPALRDHCELVGATLGEHVVLNGALLLARDQFGQNANASDS